MHVRVLITLLALVAVNVAALPALASTRAPHQGSRSFVQRHAAGSSAVQRHASNSRSDALAVAPANNILPLSDGAMPFLRVHASNSSVEVHEPALQALASLPAPVCVLTMAGAAHEGKSSWLNMFASWVADKWQTSAGANDFKVGSSIFDSGTEGAWIRLLAGKDGQPLPGTECASLALIDTQGPPRSLSLDASSSLAAGRLFSLSTLASSTVALNVMSPVMNQLAQLQPMLLHAKQTLLGSTLHYSLSDLPSLLLIERDARAASALAPADAAASASTAGASAPQQRLPSAAALEYALLEPRGDALDGARSAVRALFFNRSLTQMAMPDAHDLECLSVGTTPPSHAIPGLSLSGARPFYASFDASAHAALALLRPKSLGGVPLPGREIATALATLVDQVNHDEPASLHGAVYESLRQQADEAIEAGVRSGIDSLRTSLLPAPHAEESEDGAMIDESEDGSGDLALPSAWLTPASLELALGNATETALDAFARVAPAFGSSDDGEPAAWLEPYASVVVAEMRVIEREARVTLQRSLSRRRERRLAERFESEVESRVQGRVAEEVERALQERQGAWQAAAGSSPIEAAPPPDRRKELLTSLAFLAVGASANAFGGAATLARFLPAAAVSACAPALASAPTFLALVGIYRVAQRPIARAADAVGASAKAWAARAGDALRALAPRALAWA